MISNVKTCFFRNNFSYNLLSSIIIDRDGTLDAGYYFDLRTRINE